MAISPKIVEKIKKIAKKNQKGKVVKAEVPAGSKGKPLDKHTRAVMEEGFGADFSKVRVHTGRKATDACKAIGAKAFTQGSDVYFAGAGTDKGLLAHELTHVIQQKNGRGLKSGFVVIKKR